MLHEFIEPMWADLRGYAQRLVADLSEEDMVAQPIRAVTMNHPAWILSHLNAYAPVVTGILYSEPVEDPIDHPFGRSSTPLADRSAYPSRDELIRSFVDGYDQLVDALAIVPEASLAEPPPIERWLARFPTVGHLPVYFVAKHNAQHLGQLSAWRRAMGRPPV